jgi:hypothetical protein
LNAIWRVLFSLEKQADVAVKNRNKQVSQNSETENSDDSASEELGRRRDKSVGARLSRVPATVKWELRCSINSQTVSRVTLKEKKNSFINFSNSLPEYDRQCREVQLSQCDVPED